MSPPESPAAAHTVAPLGVTDARRVAEEICADVRGGALLDPSFERRAAALEGRDRRWTQELVYGMLRTRARLDAYLDARVRGGLARLDPNIIDLLRLGAYQLLSMGSVPAYAAIAQTVEMVKRRHGIGASRIANAVLRRLDREREHLDLPALADPIDALALAHSHPRWLVARWVGRWGIEATARLLETNNLEAAMYIRPFGIVREQLEAMLDSAGVHVEDAPIATDSLRLTKPSTLTELSAFRQGLMFVQDPASTLVTRYAAIPAGSVVADLCAAPGGKALELSRQASMVVAADRSVQRLGRLRANIERLDARNIVLLAADAREPATTAMTATLLDAPCTGTGTFRRHPDARWRLKISDIAVMAAQQRALLAAAAANVRAGGLLIYSTCSLETEENDEQVDAFLGTHPHWRLEPPPPGTVPPEVLDHGLLRVLPHRHGTDGAFAARLRRTGA